MDIQLIISQYSIAKPLSNYVDPKSAQSLASVCQSFDYFCSEYYMNRITLTPTLINNNLVLKENSHLIRKMTYVMSVDQIPNSITHLTFGFHFNQSVDQLPNSITHLTFGFYFNQSVDKLPNSITHLTFGPDFNKSIVKLPNSLKNR